MDVNGDYFICVKTLAVGVTLIAIGVMGIHEAKSSLYKDGVSEDESNLGIASLVSKRGNIYMTYFMNGLVLGLSWDGLPSLAPSLALPEITSAVTFLLFYCLGTALFMGTISGLFARCASLLGDVTDQRLPISLALVASIFAVVAGCFCLLKGVLVVSLLPTGSDTPTVTVHLILIGTGFFSLVCSLALISVCGKYSTTCAELLKPFLFFVQTLNRQVISRSDVNRPQSHVHIV